MFRCFYVSCCVILLNGFAVCSVILRFFLLFLDGFCLVYLCLVSKKSEGIYIYITQDRQIPHLLVEGFLGLYMCTCVCVCVVLCFVNLRSLWVWVLIYPLFWLLKE